MGYSSYTVRGLIENDSFHRMVKGDAMPEEIEQWDRWIEENPANRKLAREASIEILGFKFNDPDIPNLPAEWGQLYQQTIGAEKKARIHSRALRRRKRKLINWMFRMAAVILVIGSVGAGIYFTDVLAPPAPEQPVVRSQTISTGQNEQKTIKLSDGSTIVLNANSSLTYFDGWVHGKAIRVALKGEAFFHVTKRKSADQPEFQVITPDGLIRDMGTKFIVTVREDHSRVVLQEGWVLVELESVDASAQAIDVHAGEMLGFTQDGFMPKKRVNPTFYSSWATGAIEFDETPVREFTGYVEQRFGVTVVVGNTELSDKKINGAVYYRSLEDLVRSVSTVLKVPVYRSAESDTVFIGMGK